jgi:hypothetical protein
MMFRLYTVMESNGDGSYRTNKFGTQADADKYEEDNLDKLECTDAGSSEDFKYEKGNLYFSDYVDNPETGRLEKTWVKMEKLRSQ